VRSDVEKAIPLLDSLRVKHPKLARHVLSILGRTGRPEELVRAIAIYQTPTDTRGSLTSAVSTIEELADWKDIAKLTYRKKLPKWMNERLVSVIRSKGGDQSVFPFVESYYLEFLQGRSEDNFLTCVAAFERIGDGRALPYLREIFKNTDRKNDAASAIGFLMLDRAERRSYVDNPTDKHVHTITNPNSSPKELREAWKMLLENRGTAVKRMVKNGPLRSAIEHAPLDWSVDDREKYLFVARFGDVAALRLLEASEGASLEYRYQIARLLEILLPDSRSVIQAASSDQSADTDRRLTAALALQIARSQPQ
jgi:hypothetical protein